MGRVPESLPLSLIRVLHIPLDESGAGWELYFEQLTSEERDRASRFRFDADRLRFAKCRAILRRTLGEMLGVPPRDVVLRFGEHGKPHLPEGHDIEFNVSHTRGAGLIAIHRGDALGVDVEHAKRMSDLDGVARRVFTAREQDQLFAMGEAARRTQFFRLWTAKEAFLKAIGSGLSLAPSCVEAFLPQRDGRPGYFECPQVKNAGSLSCVEIALPGSTDLAATLCAPRESSQFEVAITS